MFLETGFSDGNHLLLNLDVGLISGN